MILYYLPGEVVVEAFAAKTEDYTHSAMIYALLLKLHAARRLPWAHIKSHVGH